MDLAQVALDPGAVAQAALVGDRLDDDRARARAIGLGADLELDPLADGPLELAVDLAVGLDLLAVDRQQKLARLDVDSRRGQGSAKARVPEGAAVDRLEPVTAIGRLVVGPEQADGDRLGFVEALAAAEVAVSDRQLAEHHADHAVQIAAGREVGEELFVLGSNGVPVGPVHVGRVEVVAVDPPGLVEDLRPFRPGLDRHRDRVEVERAVALGELAGVDDAQDELAAPAGGGPPAV